jgi:Tfp pilus assembly protein PilN
LNGLYGQAFQSAFSVDEHFLTGCQGGRKQAMIEINLLPEDMRKSEGTPPARLLVIFLSVGVLCAIGFFIVNYRFVQIPGKKGEIANLDSEINNLKVKEAEVQKKKAEIQVVDAKNKALDDLMGGRVRYGRMIDLIWRAVPKDDIWFKSFKVVADNSAAVVPGMPGGKSYQIELLGFATGEKDSDMTEKLNEMVGNLRQKLEIKEKPRAGENVPPKYGVCAPLRNVKFLEIKVPEKKMSDTLPEPDGLDPKVKETFKGPKHALDFTMTIKFQVYQPQVN